MTLLINKRSGGRIRYARETFVGAKRMLDICRDYEDGLTTDEWVEMPKSDRPLLFIPNFGGDLDETYLRDIIQSFYGRKPAQRLNKPNITTLYHEMNERRARDLENKTVIAIPQEAPRGN